MAMKLQNKTVAMKLRDLWKMAGDFGKDFQLKLSDLGKISDLFMGPTDCQGDTIGWYLNHLNTYNIHRQKLTCHPKKGHYFFRVWVKTFALSLLPPQLNNNWHANMSTKEHIGKDLSKHHLPSKWWSIPSYKVTTWFKNHESKLD